MRALRASSVYSGVGLKTISPANRWTSSTLPRKAERAHWPVIEPRRLHLADTFAAPRGAGAPLLNPPVVTAPRSVCGAARRGRHTSESAGLTAAAAWLVRAAFVRSNRPVSIGRWTLAFRWVVRPPGLPRRRAVPAVARPAWRRLAQQEAASGTSALASSRVGRGETAEREGAASREGPTATTPARTPSSIPCAASAVSRGHQS